MKQSAQNRSAGDTYPHPLLEDAATLAGFQGWREEEYRDLLAVQKGTLSEAQFVAKYSWTTAILVLDMTDFTRCTIQEGELVSLLRIVDAHKVCLPVLQDSGAGFIRSFADDLVALFPDPADAVSAAFEIHERIRLFEQHKVDKQRGVSCCIGIGYGQVLRIGPNFAQGDEMNRASKLGEDIANAEQTLVTHNVFSALQERKDLQFLDRKHAAAPFPFYQARPAD